MGISTQQPTEAGRLPCVSCLPKTKGRGAEPDSRNTSQRNCEMACRRIRCYRRLRLLFWRPIIKTRALGPSSRPRKPGNQCCANTRGSRSDQAACPPPHRPDNRPLNPARTALPDACAPGARDPSANRGRDRVRPWCRGCAGARCAARPAGRAASRR